jgi:hypothetical protein
MEDAQRQHSELAGRDASDFERYRAVSITSVIALLLGLASALALAHPVLWFLPVAAAGTAVAGLRTIARSDGGLTGRWAALAGLALALLFGSWAPTRLATRQTMIAGHARHAAEAWLGLVRAGHLQQAHQWTLPPVARQRSPELLKPFYSATPDAAKRLEKFFQNQPLAAIVAAGERGKLEFDSTQQISLTSGDNLITLRFEFVDPADPQQPPLRFNIVVRRITGDTVGWQVVELIPSDRTAF